jgi:hypothetical protein
MRTRCRTPSAVPQCEPAFAASLGAALMTRWACVVICWAEVLSEKQPKAAWHGWQQESSAGGCEEWRWCTRAVTREHAVATLSANAARAQMDACETSQCSWRAQRQPLAHSASSSGSSVRLQGPAPGGVRPGPAQAPSGRQWPPDESQRQCNQFEELQTCIQVRQSTPACHSVSKAVGRSTSA